MRGAHLRGLLLACTGFILLIAFFLLWRLDTDALGRMLASEIGGMIHRPFQFKKVHLSFAHGLGLTLHKVEIAATPGHPWWLEARQMEATFEILPLLFGHVRFRNIFILSPSVFMVSLSAPPRIRLPVNLELDRLNIQDGRLWLSNERKVADHIWLDIRGLSRQGESRWDFKAEFGGQKLQSDGRASIRNGSIVTAFGKLKADGIPAAAIRGNHHSDWLDPYHLSTSLTFDLTSSGQWRLFGDFILKSTDKPLPSITLRGKIEGKRGSTHFSWYDSFLHIGEKTVIATSGERDDHGRYRIQVKGSAARIHDILAVTDRNIPLGGVVDMDSNLTWHENVLKGDGKLAWHSLVWSQIPIPDARADFHGLTIDPQHGVTLRKLEATRARKQGIIRLEKVRYTPGDRHVTLHLQDVENWWVEVANTIASFHGIQPSWDGSGVLSGTFEWSKKRTETSTAVQWNASMASLVFDPVFSKPVKIPATGSILMEEAPGKRSVRVYHLQLGASHLNNGVWQRSEIGQNLSVDALELNFSEARRLKFTPYEPLQKLGGIIRGSLHATIKTSQLFVENWRSWLRDLDADLSLKNFGLGNSLWNGRLQVSHGQAKSSNLRWKRDRQHASLRGSVTLMPLAGELDIQDAVFNTSGTGLPAWLKKAGLAGSFTISQLNWGENIVSNLHGIYRLEAGTLIVHKIFADLAGGEIHSAKLKIRLTESPVAFSGPVTLRDIDLGKLHWGNLGQPASGRVNATMLVRGMLPLNRWREWKGRGDVEIRNGTLTGIDLYGRIASLIGLPQPKERKETPFTRLNTSLVLKDRSLTFSGLMLNTKRFMARGEAHIDSGNRIDGTLNINLLTRNGSEKKPDRPGPVHIPVEISGRLPDISLHTAP